MKKLKKVSIDTPSAWIVSSKDRGRKSIKNGKVYLDNKETFEIEIFNPLKKSILAKIKLNGSYISTSGLVLNPGERVYLDCYIDSKRKFIFSTYLVENTKQVLDAIENNGSLEVFFYRENTIDWNSITTGGALGGYTYPTYYFGYTDGVIGTQSLSGAITTSNIVSSQPMSNKTNYSTNSVFSSSSISSTKSNIETGRVEKGSKSEQDFEYVDKDFENYCFSTTTIQLLPESRKPIYSSDLKKIKKQKNVEVISLIEKLAELYQSGVLTELEFTEKKSELLSKI